MTARFVSCLRLAAGAVMLCLLGGCANLKMPRLVWPSSSSSAAPAPTPAAPPSTAQWGDPPTATGAARPVNPVRPGAVPSVADTAYEIGPEDALEIAVWKDETLKASTLVRPDGGISFPLVGDITVAGKTTAQVRDELTRRLDKYVPEPVVNVAVVRVASYRVYVLGRVNKPGEYPLGRTVDVLQALSLAGGMTPFAEEEGIRIIRKVGGQSVSIPFDYSRVRRDGDMSQNILLKSGDVLLVP